MKDIQTFYGATLNPPGLAKLNYLGNGKIKVVLTLKGQSIMRRQEGTFPTLVFRINYLDNNNNFGYGNLIINWE